MMNISHPDEGLTLIYAESHLGPRRQAPQPPHRITNAMRSYPGLRRDV